MDNLKIATHFMVSDGVFEQHALYLTETENGKYVVFFSEEDSQIRLQILEDFLAPYDSYTTYRYSDNKRLYDDITVLNRALTALDKPEDLPHFCSGEEFVEWCFVGEPLEGNLVVSGIHIKASRGLYDHHGIYLGNFNGTDLVAHYSGFSEPLKKGEITITSLEEFQGDADTLYHIQYSPEVVAYSKFEIVDRARSRLDENSYNLFTNNCEHFAVWCITGEHRSEQVEKVKEHVTTTTTTIIGLRMMYAGWGMYTATTATTAALGISSAVGVSGIGLGTGAAIGGASAAGLVAVTGGTVATGGAITAGLIGGAVAAPILAPIAAGAAIGAGAVALWSWLKD